MKNSFHQIALIEGLSFLFLLCVAMPLKYWAGLPLFVRVGGWIHGVLFILYILWVGLLVLRGEMNFKHAILAVVFAFVPFGWRWVK